MESRECAPFAEAEVCVAWKNVTGELRPKANYVIGRLWLFGAFPDTDEMRWEG